MRSSERRGPRGIRIWEGSGRRGVQAAEGSKGKVHVGDGHRRGRGEAQAGERSRQKGSRESEWKLMETYGTIRFKDLAIV